MYNKAHIDVLIHPLWEKTLRDFAHTYDAHLTTTDWNNQEVLARFLNLCVLKRWDEHLFFTLCKLRYESITP